MEATLYGPYKRKEDGYQHVILVFSDGTRKTMSYGRYLMGEKLGRPIEDDEEVHHKDEDPTNYAIDNLVVMLKGSHQRMNKTIPNFEVWVCAYCDNSFTVTKKQISDRRRNLNRGKPMKGPFCSKPCSAKGSR